MNSRKIKNKGIIPSNSFLIHPTTLLIVKQTEIKQKKIKTQNKNIYLIPSINFSKEEILKFYNITYIIDLENTLNNYPELTRIRLLKIILSNSNITNITKDKQPNIYNFLLNYFNLDKISLNKKLNLLQTKSFNDIFYKN